jgi:hypothetical protein
MREKEGRRETQRRRQTNNYKTEISSERIKRAKQETEGTRKTKPNVLRPLPQVRGPEEGRKNSSPRIDFSLIGAIYCTLYTLYFFLFLLAPSFFPNIPTLSIISIRVGLERPADVFRPGEWFRQVFPSTTVTTAHLPYLAIQSRLGCSSVSAVAWSASLPFFFFFLFLVITTMEHPSLLSTVESLLSACLRLQPSFDASFKNLQKLGKLVASLPSEPGNMRTSELFTQFLFRVQEKLGDEYIRALKQFLQWIADQSLQTSPPLPSPNTPPRGSSPAPPSHTRGSLGLFTVMDRFAELCFLSRVVMRIKFSEIDHKVQVEASGSPLLRKRAVEQSLRDLYQTNSLFVRSIYSGSEDALAELDIYSACLHHSDVIRVHPGVAFKCTEFAPIAQLNHMVKSRDFASLGSIQQYMRSPLCAQLLDNARRHAMRDKLLELGLSRDVVHRILDFADAIQDHEPFHRAIVVFLKQLLPANVGWAVLEDIIGFSGAGAAAMADFLSFGDTHITAREWLLCYVTQAVLPPAPITHPLFPEVLSAPDTCFQTVDPPGIPAVVRTLRQKDVLQMPDSSVTQFRNQTLTLLGLQSPPDADYLLFYHTTNLASASTIARTGINLNIDRPADFGRKGFYLNEYVQRRSCMLISFLVQIISFCLRLGEEVQM